MASLNQKAYLIAIQELGVKEVTGLDHNPRIVEYHQSCTLKALTDEVPWCAAFVNWCIQQVGGQGTKSALARSFLAYGKKSTGKEGDIVVLKRGNSKTQGHVGFLVSKGWFTITVLGGNQDDKVCYQTFLRLKVLDYRESWT